MIAIPIETAALALLWYSGAFAAAVWRVFASFPTLDHYRPPADALPVGPSAPAARVLSDRLTPPRVTQDPRVLEKQRMIDAEALGLSAPPGTVKRPALPGRLDDDDDDGGGGLACSLTLAPALDDDDDDNERSSTNADL